MLSFLFFAMKVLDHVSFLLFFFWDREQSLVSFIMVVSLMIPNFRFFGWVFRCSCHCHVYGWVKFWGQKAKTPERAVCFSRSTFSVTSIASYQSILFFFINCTKSGLPLAPWACCFRLKQRLQWLSNINQKSVNVPLEIANLESTLPRHTLSPLHKKTHPKHAQLHKFLINALLLKRVGVDARLRSLLKFQAPAPGI